jgi:hypothetical protein
MDDDTNDADEVLAGEHLAALIVVARAIDTAGVEKLIQTARQFDTVTSMLDPTRWMRQHAGVHASADVARAFLAFRAVIDRNTRA